MIKLTLREYLDKNKITRYWLANKTCIRFQIIDKYYKNNVTRYDSYVLDRICSALKCNISDIIIFEDI